MSGINYNNRVLDGEPYSVNLLMTGSETLISNAALLTVASPLVNHDFYVDSIEYQIWTRSDGTDTVKQIDIIGPKGSHLSTSDVLFFDCPATDTGETFGMLGGNTVAIIATANGLTYTGSIDVKHSSPATIYKKGGTVVAAVAGDGAWGLQLKADITKQGDELPTFFIFRGRLVPNGKIGTPEPDQPYKP